MVSVLKLSQFEQKSSFHTQNVSNRSLPKDIHAERSQLKTKTNSKGTHNSSLTLAIFLSQST